MKKLAVIILNWNGVNLLKKFIPTASRFSISEESDLIVADNGSTDGSTEWLKANHPEIKLLEFDKNYGFAEGYNRAIETCDYEYIVLLNSDVEVTEGWWQPLLAFMESNPEAGAVQPKIMAYTNRGKFEYAGAAGGYLDCLGYPYCRGRLFDFTETDNGQYDTAPSKVCWASGACMMTRRKVYLELGGLDPRFFAHMEEIDLCCRMINAGYDIYAISSAKVYHVGGASLAAGNPQKTYLNFRNNLLLLYKNLPKKEGKRKIFMRRLADSLAFFMFVIKRDFSNARAIIKAHNDYMKMRPTYHPLPDGEHKKFPGSNRNAVIARYLLREKSLSPS